MMTTEQTTKCEEYHLGDSAFTTRSCTYPAKGQDDEGRWLCGGHLAGVRRRQATMDRFRAAQDGSNANKDRAALAVDILKELDTAANVHYQHSYSTGQSGYTGNIVIDPADLFRLLGMGVQLPGKQRYTEAK